jgi:hypothetical protein
LFSILVENILYSIINTQTTNNKQQKKQEQVATSIVFRKRKPHQQLA